MLVYRCKSQSGQHKEFVKRDALTWRQVIGPDASLRCHLAGGFESKRLRPSVKQLIIAKSSGENPEEFYYSWYPVFILVFYFPPLHHLR